MGKLAYLMMSVVHARRFSNHVSPVFNVKINHTIISNTLIDLGVVINVITNKSMEALGHSNFRKPHGLTSCCLFYHKTKRDLRGCTSLCGFMGVSYLLHCSTT